MEPESVPGKLWALIKKYPIWAAILAFIIAVNLVGLFTNLTTGFNVWRLEKQAAEKQKEIDELSVEREKLIVQQNQQAGRIQVLTQQSEEKDVLLKISSEKVLSSEKSLSTATADYNRIMGDTSPLSKDELRNKLCALYNVPPEACK